MARSLVLSNGELCVALDECGQVWDLYYPHVGLENHVRGHYIHRMGVWVDGAISWFSEDKEWDITVSSGTDSLQSVITAQHKRLGLEITLNDIVLHEKSVFLRDVMVRNTGTEGREIKFYFCHQFEIYKSHGSDTAYYDPISHGLIHYKGRRVFLITATIDGSPFQDYATGLAHVQNKEGTHKDAEDGMLSKNPIEHGAADSVLGVYGYYDPGQSRHIEYRLLAAQSISDAHELESYVRAQSPSLLFSAAVDYWRAWVNAHEWNFPGLTESHSTLFKRSLMFIRAHVDHEGGILASVDSDMLQYGFDTYSYVWPRDAAYIASTLDHAGESNVSRRFYEFCKGTIQKEGYFMHKYLPDRSLGSSWHPWVRDGHSELPIQEDETALVVVAIKDHYQRTRDVEFLEEMYDSVVHRAAEFMVSFRDPVTRLPLASYDLWEEKHGVSTFTCAAVYGALSAAAELAHILGKREQSARFSAAAKDIQSGIIEYLWDEAEGFFIKLCNRSGNSIDVDRTLDLSSVYGVFSFGVLPPDDVKVVRAFEQSVRRLSYGIEAGGLARYEGDYYYHSKLKSAGNPWFVTTLWYAEYVIALAKKDKDLDHVRDIFTWVTKHAQQSGVLSEQLDPETGAQLSATPLTWSHAAYVAAVLKYVDKSVQLRNKK